MNALLTTVAAVPLLLLPASTPKVREPALPVPMATQAMVSLAKTSTSVPPTMAVAVRSLVASTLRALVNVPAMSGMLALVLDLLAAPISMSVLLTTVVAVSLPWLPAPTLPAREPVPLAQLATLELAWFAMMSTNVKLVTVVAVPLLSLHAPTLLALAPAPLAQLAMKAMASLALTRMNAQQTTVDALSLLL